MVETICTSGYEEHEWSLLLSMLLLRVGIKVWCGCLPVAGDEKTDIDGADFDGIGIDRIGISTGSNG
uniref:Uncharacterized protein n=1 Tax=Cannabis sativa TaxID=3483 RepID=A0A803P8W2_CANSA